MKLKKSLMFAVALGLSSMAGSALAEVTFDPATGVGFVGKGDVQDAFGWNNAGLQANGEQVSFSLQSQARYRATCFWTTGEGHNGQRDHYVDHNRYANVSGTVNYATRKNPQQMITGYNLTGFGETVESGEVPVVGGVCVGGPTGAGQDGIWINVELVSGGEGGNLFVTWNGTSVQLYY